MLLRFFCENYASFRDEVEFSMIAGRTHQHSERLMRTTASKGKKVLKTAVIYGANASGKSNLIRAMWFAQRQIVRGTKLKQAILYNPFRLSPTSQKHPSRFEFEIQIDKVNYNYGFKLDSARVLEEWLYRLGAESQDKLFERETDLDGNTKVNLGSIKLGKGITKKFIDFVALGTRPNQLFLTESIERNIKLFEPIYNWFKNNLIFIFPDTQHMPLVANLENDEIFKSSLVKYLSIFDLGISDISLKEALFEEDLDIPKALRNRIREDSAQEAEVKTLVNGLKGQRYLITKTPDGEVRSRKLTTTHKAENSEDNADFDLQEESDGTRRLFDLIPALITLCSKDRTFVIDELDRSLHPELSRKVIELFHLNATDRDSQLIVTTHESSLLDLDLLRRDEIWFVEKDTGGASKVYSLEEFAPRYDKDIRKGYLVGRFGAVPLISSSQTLQWIK